MNQATRKLLSDALSKHEVCMSETAGARDQAEIVRRLVEIERECWCESPVEVENEPMTYRHLLSRLDDLSVIEQRYAACEHSYLKEALALRYWEILGGITDMDELMRLAVQAHPGLRVFAILRFQERLPEALEGLSPDEIPQWFTRFLAQPAEMSNYVSQSSCLGIMDKVRALLEG